MCVLGVASFGLPCEVLALTKLYAVRTPGPVGRIWYPALIPNQCATRRWLGKHSCPMYSDIGTHAFEASNMPSHPLPPPNLYVHTFLSRQRPASCETALTRCASPSRAPAAWQVRGLQRRLDRLWTLPRPTAGMVNEEPYYKQALPFLGVDLTCGGYMNICLHCYYPRLYLSLYICIYIYICMCLSPSLSRSLSLYTYIYI